ncbi:Hpr1 [Lachancea thermotolerans]
MERKFGECLKFAKGRLETIEWDESVLLSPIPQEKFPDELINDQWCSESLSKDYELRLQEAAIKKLFFEGSELPENERVVHFAVIMDLCHHLGRLRGEDSAKKLWITTYFELFKQALSFLCLPRGHLKFWPYVETRMHWFQSGYAPEVKYGQTNLSAIKAPFSKITFHINKLLSTMREQSKLSTPLHYKLGMKIHWFLSQCLSPMEQANTNRRGNFAKSLPEQLWDTKASKFEDAPAFFNDLRKVEHQFVSDPLGWAFTDPSQRLSLERYLLPVIDEILLHESYFYAQIKRKNLRLDRLKHKLHLRASLSSGSIAVSRDMTKANKNSTGMSPGNSQNEPFTVRPLMLDQPSWDPELVLSRLQDPSNDFFRKQVVIQLVIASNLVERVLEDDSIKAFYSSQHYQNLDPSVGGDSEKTLKDLGYFIKDRVRRFYEQRDTVFQGLLDHMLINEDALLELKTKRGFKIFSSFTFPEKGLSEAPSPKYSFKGFGWSKFGNKKLDAAWKTETGLQNIKMDAESPQAVFEELRTEYKTEDTSVSDTAHHDTVKQWRQMRVLRPQYVFQLGNVDERTGMEGLFNENVVTESQNHKKELRMEREEESRKAHDKKLEEARSYFAMKKKRPIDSVENASLPPSKKQTTDSSSPEAVTEVTLNERASATKEHKEAAQQLPENVIENPDSTNTSKPSSEENEEMKPEENSEQLPSENITETHGKTTTLLPASPEDDSQIKDTTEAMASDSSKSTNDESTLEAAGKS